MEGYRSELLPRRRRRGEGGWRVARTAGVEVVKHVCLRWRRRRRSGAGPATGRVAMMQVSSHRWARRPQGTGQVTRASLAPAFLVSGVGIDDVVRNGRRRRAFWAVAHQGHPGLGCSSTLLTKGHDLLTRLCSS